MPKIRKNYGVVGAESIRTYGRTYVRTYEGKSIGPPKFLGEVQKYAQNLGIAIEQFTIQNRENKAKKRSTKNEIRNSTA